MAVVNKLTTLMPAFGAPTEYLTLLAQNVPINATTTFTLTGFINFIRSGRVRAKSTTAPAAAQITAIKVTGTDGTNFVTLYQDATARTAAEFEDFMWSFISELNLTSISVALTLANAGTAYTFDFEVTGNP
jgi:hypothetical protein